MKKRGTAEAELKAASTYQALTKLLSAANHYNGTLVHCFLEWWHCFDQKHPGLITVFGAPYEAEAQCAEVERCGLVDAVLSVDTDMVVHGVKHFIRGFNKNSDTIREAYVKTKHPIFKDMPDKQRVAFAVFCGCDYDPGLQRVGWKKGQEVAAGWVAAEARSTADGNKYLVQVATDCCRADPENYPSQFRLCMKHFLHYPVFRLTFDQPNSSQLEKRKALFQRHFSVHLALARPLADHTVQSLFDRLNTEQFREPIMRKQFATMSLWARRDDPLVDTPFPSVDGRELEYGSVIDWETWEPKHLSPEEAHRFLWSHSVAVSSQTPYDHTTFSKMAPYQRHIFGHCLLDRVNKIKLMLRNGEIRPKLRHELSMDASLLHWRRKANCCYFEWKSDAKTIFNHIVPLVSIPNADDLQDYGERPELEMRALRGVQAANIFLEQLRISQVVQTKTEKKSALILFEVPVMSSMHSKTWHVCTTFSQSTGAWMHAPYSFCSCPQGSYLCSHQMQVLAALRILQLFYGDVRAEIRKNDGECCWRETIQPHIHDLVDRQKNLEIFCRSLAAKEEAANTARKKRLRRVQAANKETKESQWTYHRPCGNDRITSKLVESDRDTLHATVMLFWPPSVRRVSGMSLPLCMKDDAKLGAPIHKRATAAAFKTHPAGVNFWQAVGEIKAVWLQKFVETVRHKGLSWRKQAVHPLDPSRIVEKQKQLANEYPLSPRDQYEADLEMERAFQLAVKREIRRDTLRMHYLVHTREARLKRIKEYEASHHVNGEDAAGYVDDEAQEPDVEPAEDEAVPVANADAEQLALAQRLEGRWECEENLDTDVAAEHISVLKMDDTSMSCTYNQDKTTFAIDLSDPQKTKLVPKVAKRKRAALTWVLDAEKSTEDEIVWTLNDSSPPIKWKRSVTPDDLITRGDRAKRAKTAAALLKRRDRTNRKRTPSDRHRCSCRAKRCRAPHALQTFFMSYYPQQKKATNKQNMSASRKEKATILQKRQRWFKYNMPLGVGAPQRPRFHNHHWPRNFFTKYPKRKPSLIPFDEAIETGMYVRGRLECTSLLVKTPGSSASQKQQSVICVPWLLDVEGAAQYPIDPEDPGHFKTPSTKKKCRRAADPEHSAVSQALFDPVPPAKKMCREPPPDSTSHGLLARTQLSKFATDKWCSVNDRCQRHYGWSSYKEMVNWLTKVHFPGLSMERVGAQVLSDFEQCIFVIAVFRSRDDMVRKCDVWNIKPQTASGYMKKWSKKLERTAKIWSRLRFDGKYLRACQTEGMANSYSLPISHLVDGTVCQAQFSRSSNTLKRIFYNSKIHSSGTLALAHTTPSGLVLFATDMFCGGAQEPDLVRIYQSWWDEYPKGFGRLVDKGFATFTSIYYKNGSKAIHPKFLTQHSAKFSKTGSKQLQADSIIDGAKQSKDRYVVETVFSRVKRTLRLGTIVTWGCLSFINACYLWGCASAGLYEPLQKPVDWDDLDKHFEAAAKLQRGTKGAINETERRKYDGIRIK